VEVRARGPVSTPRLQLLLPTRNRKSFKDTLAPILDPSLVQSDTSSNSAPHFICYCSKSVCNW
jgi:hypothetical protein